ncbi:hypothetical protein VNO78_31309 [Psophocarpus tetragonolobus]|uniref:Uncharacterized protein n=1 Tax=Psophocarpus tetragonolobus TaxID=3891 RepID=A0AAN9RY83_PSOTE
MLVAISTMNDHNVGLSRIKPKSHLQLGTRQLEKVNAKQSNSILVKYDWVLEESNSYWLSRCAIGKLRPLKQLPNVAKGFYLQGLILVNVKSPEGDLVFLSGLEKVDNEDILASDDKWWSDMVVSIQKWDSSCIFKKDTMQWSEGELEVIGGGVSSEGARKDVSARGRGKDGYSRDEDQCALLNGNNLEGTHQVMEMVLLENNANSVTKSMPLGKMKVVWLSHELKSLPVGIRGQSWNPKIGGRRGAPIGTLSRKVRAVLTPVHEINSSLSDLFALEFCAGPCVSLSLPHRVGATDFNFYFLRTLSQSQWCHSSGPCMVFFNLTIPTHHTSAHVSQHLPVPHTHTDTPKSLMRIPKSNSTFT